MKKRIFAVDLDGTLLNEQSEISEENRNALQKARQHGIITVAATGRSWQTARNVLKADDPIEYLVFSSGLGVCEWAEGERLIHENHLDPDTSTEILSRLRDLRLTFMAHLPIPDNHLFYYEAGDDAPQTDLSLRVNALGKHAKPLPNDRTRFPEGLAQFIITIPHSPERFESLERLLSPTVQVIRTTSPFDGHSIWLELFPKGINKASGIKWLCEHLRIPENLVAAIGNDYNDLSMLEAFPHAYVVDNAPHDLKEMFPTVPANTEHGVATAINELIKKATP